MDGQPSGTEGLTIVTCPKLDCNEKTVFMQHNALRSWLAMIPKPQVVVVGARVRASECWMSLIHRYDLDFVELPNELEKSGTNGSDIPRIPDIITVSTRPAPRNSPMTVSKLRAMVRRRRSVCSHSAQVALPCVGCRQAKVWRVATSSCTSTAISSCRRRSPRCPVFKLSQAQPRASTGRRIQAAIDGFKSKNCDDLLLTESVIVPVVNVPGRSLLAQISRAVTAVVIVMFKSLLNRICTLLALIASFELINRIAMLPFA